LSDDDTRGTIFPTRLKIDDSIDWSAFALWLSALLHARGNDLVRVKGVLPTPAGRLLLQTVRKVVQSPEILPAQENQSEDGTIVFIGCGFRPEDLQTSLRRFAGRPTGLGQKT
jgi:G3E family GTPase